MASRVRRIHSRDMAQIIGTFGNGIRCFISHVYVGRSSVRHFYGANETETMRSRKRQ
jgi:hypothetical protein